MRPFASDIWGTANNCRVLQYVCFNLQTPVQNLGGMQVWTVQAGIAVYTEYGLRFLNILSQIYKSFKPVLMLPAWHCP